MNVNKHAVVQSREKVVSMDIRVNRHKQHIDIRRTLRAIDLPMIQLHCFCGLKLGDVMTVNFNKHVQYLDTMGCNIT